MIYLQSFFKETDSARAYKNMIHTNNGLSLCPQNNNTLQIFDIEILVRENNIYRYHLEVDFIGVVKESFYVKNQYKNKYKSILSVERTNYTLSCEGEKDTCDKKQCLTEAETEYHLEIPDFEPQIEESLRKAANTQSPIGLTITKLAMLGNEHAVHFTEWIKNCLCPETNIINENPNPPAMLGRIE